MDSPVLNPASIEPPGVAPVQAPAAPAAIIGSERAVRGPAFDEVLSKTQSSEPPRFSRHALDRLQRRGIELSGPTLQRLAGGIQRAASKGSRDSVIFVDGTAFVVSVRNNTVITAVGSEHMRDHVFTNVDSAVIA